MEKGLSQDVIIMCILGSDVINNLTPVQYLSCGDVSSDG